MRIALTDTRVVAINGARQVGKSTLARRVLADVPDAQERRLDDPATLAAARRDPTAFVRHPGLLLIDEIQRAPELLLAIKDTVDLDPRPGRFLLTGSARLLALGALPDALPGRMESIELWPLSQGEIEGVTEGFVEEAFALGADLHRPGVLSRVDYAARISRGGYPDAVLRTDARRRGRLLSSYVDAVVGKDIADLREISQLTELRRLVATVAGRAGSLLVPANVAADLGAPRTTIARYIDLLEAVFLIRRIPAWSSSLTRRAIGTPKVVFTDSGLLAQVLGLDAESLSSVRASNGHLVESFALSELARQLEHSHAEIRLHHYRTRDGVEVDAILENSFGAVVGIEIKATESVRGNDFAGLNHLAARLGERFRAGFVLHLGTQSLPFGPRMRALPLSAIWDMSAR
ncbi:MAG: ATP-binding protein [Sporichthyaceae bacterium]